MSAFAPFRNRGTIKVVEQLLTNKTYMNKDFEPGDILKQHDYNKKSNFNLALGAALLVGVFAAFVLPLLK